MTVQPQRTARAEVFMRLSHLFIPVLSLPLLHCALSSNADESSPDEEVRASRSDALGIRKLDPRLFDPAPNPHILEPLCGNLGGACCDSIVSGDRFGTPVRRNTCEVGLVCRNLKCEAPPACGVTGNAC